MYKNVTLNTRKMAISTVQCTRRPCRWWRHYQGLLKYSAFGIKIHNNSLPGEGEI